MAASDVYKILSDQQMKTLTMHVSRYGKKVELKVTPEDIFQ